MFIRCHDRAALVKTWLPTQYSGPPTFIDQLVYDHALQLVSFLRNVELHDEAKHCLQSRSAARKELFDQAKSPDECEKVYEESLWCLYALQDNLMQTDTPFLEEDRTTIQTCMFTSTNVYDELLVLILIADRDQTDEAPSSEMPCSDGHEQSRTTEGCSSGQESRRCHARPRSLGYC